MHMPSSEVNSDSKENTENYSESSDDSGEDADAKLRFFRNFTEQKPRILKLMIITIIRRRSLWKNTKATNLLLRR